MKSKEVLPNEVNYIAVFLTLRCNLNCSYCINKLGQFVMPQEMNANSWIEGLSKLETRADLPITLQGGEPTIYSGFYRVANALHFQHRQYLDLLTNGSFDTVDFCNQISTDVFKRNAKYASIRFSYHPKMNLMTLALKAWEMQNRGYEVGIWGLDNHKSKSILNLNTSMEDLCFYLNLDFRVKEFLSKDTGTYKYPEALSKKSFGKVWCKTNELLISPSGHIFKCHSDLYANRNWIGHILDSNLPEFVFRECSNYGFCNPCDIKVKTNRLQEFGYCAVDIKGDNVLVKHNKT